MATNYSKSLLSRRTAWIILLMIALLALAIVVLPAWIVQPFKPQSQRGLEASYEMRRWSPLVTLIALASGSMLVLWLWRGSRRWWLKAFLLIVLIPLLASTWFAQQNH